MSLNGEISKCCVERKQLYHFSQFRSDQISRSVVSDSLRPHESQHARPPCPSPTPRVHSDSCPSSQWCHLAVSSLVVPFSSCPQSLPASESSPMSQPFEWGGQSTGVSASASFLPKKSQGWSPSEWTGWISLQSKGLSRVFSSIAQLCLTLCDPMDCSMPGFPVLHQLLKLAQTHVHWVGDAIQPSHPLWSPSPPLSRIFNFKTVEKVWMKVQ